MSKGRKKKLRFLGYGVTSWEHRSIVSLIEMTAGRFGVHKRDFKNENEFWAIIERLTGFSRSPLETFNEAVCRIYVDVRSKGLAWRDTKMADVTGDEIRSLITGKSWKEVSFTLLPVKIEGNKDISSPSVSEKNEFYASWEWRTLRMQVLKEQGTTCNCCGASRGDTDMAGKPVKIVVDHIKPLSKYWHLRLEKTNLQVLCDECNMGKGNWDETDFRHSQAPDEWVIEGELNPSLVHQLTDHTTGLLQ